MSFTIFRHLLLSSVSPSSTAIFPSGVLLSFKFSLMSPNSRSFLFFSRSFKLPKRTSKMGQNAFSLEVSSHEMPFQLKLSRHLLCRFSKPKQNKLNFLPCILVLYICVFIEKIVYFSFVFNWYIANKMEGPL